jgi:hypothetical protein
LYNKTVEDEMDMHRKDENVYKILIRKSEGKDPKWESSGIGSRIISKWILNKQGMMWIAFLPLAKQRVQR